MHINFTDILPIPKVRLIKKNQKPITFRVSGGNGQRKYVTRYDRLDLGVPVEVGHIAVPTSGSDTSRQVSLSVVPGGLYRVKVWIISGQQISLAPNETTYRANSSGMFCSIVN